MRISYYAETDTLYIDLNGRPSAESEEVAPDVVFDFDAEDRLTGIEIEHASKFVDLKSLDFSGLSLTSDNGRTKSSQARKPRTAKSGRGGSTARPVTKLTA